MDELDEEHKEAVKELKRLDYRKACKRQLRYKQFDESDLRNVRLKEGLVFANPKVFKDVVHEYGIKIGRSIMFPCNEKHRVRRVCKGRANGYPWTVYASTFEVNNPGLMIRSLTNMHSCPRVQKNKLANANWLSKKFTEELRPGGNFRLGDFLGKVKQEYVLAPSKNQVYRAKRKAGLLIEGTLASQYDKLWDYAEELKRSNLGTTVVFDNEMGHNQTPIFKRIYIFLHACKLGWLNGCRPIIGLDGCHIKGYHKSQLLLAIGIDANNCYYHVAYAVVEKECYTFWFWFLDLLKLDLRLERSVGVTFMTDKQKGLVKAISQLSDGCEHRNCVHHFYANFQLKFKNQLLRDKVWQAARATTVIEFTRVMQDIKNISEEAHNWLSAKPTT
ncbi:hypothetical protein UlMin_011278 [Ulmus minor]